MLPCLTCNMFNMYTQTPGHVKLRSKIFVRNSHLLFLCRPCMKCNSMCNNQGAAQFSWVSPGRSCPLRIYFCYARCLNSLSLTGTLLFFLLFSWRGRWRHYRYYKAPSQSECMCLCVVRWEKREEFEDSSWLPEEGRNTAAGKRVEEK